MKIFIRRSFAVVMTIIFFAILGSLASCSGQTAIVMPSITVSPTNIPSLVIATPTPPKIFNIDADTHSTKNPLVFDPAYMNLQSGKYLVNIMSYVERQELMYYSLDGTRIGLVGKFLEIPDFWQEGYSYAGASSYTNDFLEPSYMGVLSRQKDINTLDSSDYPLIELVIQSANLRTTEQYVWEGVFLPGKGILCDDLTLSPNHEWLVWNCWVSGENYLYLINIWGETAKFIHSTEYPCLSDEYGSVSWWYFDWSPDSKWLFASCGEDWFNRTMSCLLSPDDGEIQCSSTSSSYLPEAWSLDGSKVAIEQGDDLIITSPSCFIDSLSCPEYLHSSITSGTTLDSVIWSLDGNTVFWSSYPTDYTAKGYSTICSANLSTSAIDCFAGQIGVSLISLSPDGQWFVISFEDAVSGLPVQALLSTNGQILRRLEGLFEAWLVIP